MTRPSTPKIDLAAVRRIREVYAARKALPTLADLAKEYGVSRGLVTRIAQGFLHKRGPKVDIEQLAQELESATDGR